MFKKPLAHQSNATPIRSSTRRQIVQSVFQQYPSLLAGVSDEGVDGVSAKELGKIILPEGVKTSNIETSGGVEGTIYAVDGGPYWMSFGRNSKELIPTLYLLAHTLPSPPLPTIKLHYPLPPPLFTGAPLFLPAVRNLHKPWLIPDVPENGIVAFVVCPTGDDMVQYAGVGRVVAKGGMRGAVERLVKHRQEGLEVDEGRFCDILCIINDHLWEMGSKPALPTFTMPIPSNPLAPPPKSEITPEAGPSRSRPPSPSIKVDKISDELETTNLNVSEKADVQTLSAAEISTLLNQALHQALSTLSGSPFPMLASLLYSAHILPNRPAYIPFAQRDDVVIAKSEWKKLAKWMKELQKEGVLKIKESKGEVIATGYDPKHPVIDGHAPFVTIAQEEAKAAKKAAREDSAAVHSAVGVAGGKGKNKEISIEELWKPSGPSSTFWEARGVEFQAEAASKSTIHPPSLIKSTVDEYITSHKLVDPKNHRMILLDEELGRAVAIKQPLPGQTMARDDILAKLRAGVAWSVSIGGVIKKGTLSPILLSVQWRTGRKRVTVISGLETFGVNIIELAEELKKSCAGSTSIQPLSGVSRKLQLQELIVQGPQVEIITDALIARGVPKKWIKAEEKR